MSLLDKLKEEGFYYDPSMFETPNKNTYNNYYNPYGYNSNPYKSDDKRNPVTTFSRNRYNRDLTNYDEILAHLPLVGISAIRKKRLNFANKVISQVYADYNKPIDLSEFMFKEECAICQTEVENGPTDGMTLDCRHRFHWDCINGWGKYNADDVVNPLKHMCPLCKTQGHIPLNLEDPFHQILMDQETLTMNEKYTEPKKIFKFCKNYKNMRCREKVFCAGDETCGGDYDKLPKLCQSCDKLDNVDPKKTKICPSCGVAINWISGCQKVQCQCRLYYCFIHLKTPKEIHTELTKLKNEDRNGVYAKIKSGRYAEYLDNGPESSYHVYNCPWCWEEGCEYR